MNRYIRINQKQIHYTVDGDSAKSVVLLHGFLESVEIWQEMIATLQNEFKVIAIDLLGHGRSDDPEEDLSMQQQAQVVEAVLSEENIEKTVVVGHSMGGYVAAEFAAYYPKRIQGLVFFHSHMHSDSPSVKENRQKMIDILEKTRNARFIHRFLPELLAAKNRELLAGKIEQLKNISEGKRVESIIAIEQSMLKRNSRLAVAEMEVPFLFIIGKEDAKIPPQNILAQAYIPQESEIQCLGTGHLGFWEEAEKTQNILRNFINRCYFRRFE